MHEWINNKLMPKVMAFVNTKPVTALKEGMVTTMPLIITGSIFLILANLPIESAAQFLEQIGVAAVANKAYAATFNISAIIAAIGIAYNYAKSNGFEPLGCGMISLACFLLIQPNTITSASGDVVSNLINQDWTAGKGMIGSIICGLLVGAAYSWFLKKDIRIKMPAGVPQGVSNAFSALIPGVAIITVTAIIHGVTEAVAGQSLMELIYTIIQIPLQGVTDSLPGVIVYAFMVSFLWFFGVHGSTIMGGLMTALFTANYLDNQAIIDAGMELTVANGGHIVTQQFIDQFITVTGSGVTIGLVIYMLFMAKSSAFKTLGRLEIGPAIFNINEPILFGLPIVMNPTMMLPFILVPICTGVTQYFALRLGICPLYKAILVPWTTPPILSGFLIGGWRTALLQIVCLLESVFIYLPFARKIDMENLKQEQEAAAKGADDDDDDW